MTFIDTFNKLGRFHGFAMLQYRRKEGLFNDTQHQKFNRDRVGRLLYAMPVAAQPQQKGPWFFKVDGGGVHQSEADSEG